MLSSFHNWVLKPLLATVPAEMLDSVGHSYYHGLSTLQSYSMRHASVRFSPLEFPEVMSVNVLNILLVNYIPEHLNWTYFQMEVHSIPCVIVAAILWVKQLHSGELSTEIITEIPQNYVQNSKVHLMFD